MKEEKNNVKKPFYKKWWFWIIIILIVEIFGKDSKDKNIDTSSELAQKIEKVDGTQSTKMAIDTSSELTEKDENIQSLETKSEDEFIEDVKRVIQGAINSEREAIIDVELKNRDLYVYVDFSNTDPAPFTLEDLAWSRTSSITDAILELNDYDTLWDAVIIDFGDIGKIRNGKECIEENEYGYRYFPSKNFILE